MQSGNKKIHVNNTTLAEIKYFKINITSNYVIYTGTKRSVSTMSGILAHIHTTKHQISPSDFKILSTATSETDLLIRESIFISKLNPTLRRPLSKIHPLVWGRKNRFSSYFAYELDFGQY